VRDHHYNDPRVRFFLHREPDFTMLRHLCDEEHLARQSRHYSTCVGFEQLPLTFPAPQSREIRLDLAEDNAMSFARGVLRLQFSEFGIFPEAITASLNGVKLSLIPGSGELFPPFSNEGLAAPLELFFFDLPLDAVQSGENVITLTVSPFAEFFFMGTKKVQLRGVEIALYR
jgi:hypothetical protein